MGKLYCYRVGPCHCTEANAHRIRGVSEAETKLSTPRGFTKPLALLRCQLIVQGITFFKRITALVPSIDVKLFHKVVESLKRLRRQGKLLLDSMMSNFIFIFCSRKQHCYLNGNLEDYTKTAAKCFETISKILQTFSS